MDKIKEILEILKKRSKVIFCYSLIVLAIVLVLLILVVKPQKINNDFLYDTGTKLDDSLVVSSFPIVQHIKVKQNKLYGMYLYLGSDDINKYPYTVELKDDSGKKYFSHTFNLDYESNIIYMGFPVVENSYNKDFILSITCDECANVQLAYMNKGEKNTYIEGNRNKTLGLTIDYYTNDTSYYWYSLLAIVVAITLLPLARSETNETKY